MAEFSLHRGNNGIWFGVFEHLYNAGIKHGVSTRLHGKSLPPYHSLNLGLKSEDNRLSVIDNRQLFCEAIGVNFAALVTAQQVHGDHIAIVTQKDAGRGSINFEHAISSTDALVTNVPDLPLLLFFADCVPVLIADPARKVVAISHAGWKGSVAQIAKKTVLTMQQHFGTQPGDCLVGIGPSIGQCCYEVDDAVIDSLRASFSNWETMIKPHGKGHWLLDLWEVNRSQLVAIGVQPNKIGVSGVCTACNNEMFFSHRAEHGSTGRLGALITL